MHRLRPVLSPVATNKLFAEEKAPPILEESLLFLGTSPSPSKKSVELVEYGRVDE